MVHFSKSQILSIYKSKDSRILSKFFSLLERIPMDSGILDNNLRFGAFITQVGFESAKLRYLSDITSNAKYKGRGIFKIRGKSAYKKLSNDLGIDFVRYPNKLESLEYAFKSAIWFWNSNNFNELVDKEEFRLMTELISPSMLDFDCRCSMYFDALQILSQYEHI